MDEFQDRLAVLALSQLADYGFVLAGGYALQAHGLVGRPSEDIDLFTDRWNPQDFARAVETVTAAYTRAGLDVTVLQRAETFARLEVSDPATDHIGSVDLAADLRFRPAVRFSVGPVLAERDAVGNKTTAVFSRGEARDYIDLAAILATGRYCREDLMALAADADGGFDQLIFAEALAGIDRFPDEEFSRYGVDSQQASTVRAAMHDWREQLRMTPSTAPSAEVTHAPLETDRIQAEDARELGERRRRGQSGEHPAPRRPPPYPPPTGPGAPPETPGHDGPSL